MSKTILVLILVILAVFAEPTQDDLQLQQQ